MPCKRAALAVALVATLAACPITDPSRPIGLVPADDIPAWDVRALAEGAACWNLQFGVDFRMGEAADGAEQQVEVFFDDHSCLGNATARVQAGWPMSIGLCRPRWGEIDSFLILAHELGHVLNIVGHTDGARTMRYGATFGEDMFNTVDRAELAGANDGFTPSSPCARVVRSIGLDTPDPHCACVTGAPLDLARPIVVADPVSSWESAALACWNLRYGTQLVVSGGDAPGQRARIYHYCSSFQGRIPDLDDVLVCGQSRPMFDVGQILGVSYDEYRARGSVAFDAQDDEAFHAVYPGHPIACEVVERDPDTGACACQDPAFR